MSISSSRPTLTPVSNPPNPFISREVEWLDVVPSAPLRVFEERAASILSKNDSPDISFTYSINPYRGCFHGCAYCYARPSHHYLDLGAGTDFERTLIVKPNAPELLRKAFMKPSWQGDPILFSGNTDCYQPLEASYQLTKACLEICLEFRNPVYIITKGALVRRDRELLAALAREASAHVTISIAFADDDIAKLIEPGAPRPSTRLRAMRELADAGVPVSVAVAPVIGGLNDTQIPTILERARESGAEGAFMTLLRLPGVVQEIFSERVMRDLPSRARKILNAQRGMRSGELNDSRFGHRMSGKGPRWEAIEWLFQSSCERLGLNARSHGGREAAPMNSSDNSAAVEIPGTPQVRSTFTRPTSAAGPTQQLRLFEESCPGKRG